MSSTHHSEVFWFLLLAFIGGIFTGSFFSIPQTWVLGLLLACVVFIAVFFRRDSKFLKPRMALAAFLVLFFTFGLLRFNLTQASYQVLKKFAEASEQLRNINEKNRPRVTLLGYVDTEPEIKGDKQRIVLKSKSLNAFDKTIKTDERVLIVAKLYPTYQYGDQVKIYGELILPKNFAPPAGGSDFDYISYLAKDNIFTIMNYPEIKTIPVELSFAEKIKLPIYRYIYRAKNAFENSINRSLAEPNTSFINGILLGTRSQIPPDLKEAFARTSTSHILAISGFNITLIAEIFSWFFLLFFRRRVTFWFSIIGVAVFTILTGAQASVVRAAIMGMILLVAYREGRLYGAKNAVTFAGALMILFDPRILRYDVGFQLSFMATLGLIYISPLLEKYFTSVRWKLPEFFKLREIMTMTLAAQIAVLPLLLFYFRNLSLVALPTNILVLPVIPYLMFLGFGMGLTGLIWPFLGRLIGYFVWLLSAVELGIVKFFSKASWAIIQVHFPWYLVLLVYVLIVISIAKVRKPTRAEAE